MSRVVERDAVEYDLVIVGAGPAGLAAAIRAKQAAALKGQDISVAVLEKGSEVGAHILSGAVMDPIALSELLPNWQADGAPLTVPVSEDRFYFLDADSGVKVPNWILPPGLRNHGNYVVSLGNVCRWLATQAENLGVEIFPGFAAAQVLFDPETQAVLGVITGDMGIAKDGSYKSDFAPGMEIRGRYTLFSEGCRGHLGKQLIAKFGLDANRDPQSYDIGIKELWQVDPSQHQPGLVVHSAGWPLNNNTYGGAFMYHLDNCQVVVGVVVGLAYDNPYLSPFEEFQRYKQHPLIRKTFVGGRRLSYGARAIVSGGLQALPDLVFNGGALIGDNAGFLNAMRIKGSHAAIKTGMLAADAAVDALIAGRSHDTLSDYPSTFRTSWLYKELHQTRNYKASMKLGLKLGTLAVGLDQTVLRGHAPWTLHNRKPMHASLRPAAECEPILYPKPDGKISFDRLSSVFLSNTNHEENQPSHLTLKDADVPITINLARYDAPEQRYCPAGVYEIVKEPTGARLQINAQNCVHCKTCDIKDPTQNIVWVSPEGGGGPNYPNM